MSFRWSIAVAAVLTIGTAGIAAAEMPSYEVTGFSISPHQFVVLGPTHAEQELPVVTATTAASPHQMAVMTPRHVESTSRQEHAQMITGITTGQVR